MTKQESKILAKNMIKTFSQDEYPYNVSSIDIDSDEDIGSFFFRFSFLQDKYAEYLNMVSDTELYKCVMHFNIDIKRTYNSMLLACLFLINDQTRKVFTEDIQVNFTSEKEAEIVDLYFYFKAMMENDALVDPEENKFLLVLMEKELKLKKLI